MKAKDGKSAADDTFFTSCGWFCRLKRCANLHHVSASGEGTSADKLTAEKSLKTLQEIIAKEGYIRTGAIQIVSPLINYSLAGSPFSQNSIN